MSRDEGMRIIHGENVCLSAERPVEIIQDPAPSCRQQSSLMKSLFLIQEVVWLLSRRFCLTLYRGVCRCHMQEMHSGSSRWKYGANCRSCYHKHVGDLSIHRADLNRKTFGGFFVFFLSCIHDCNEFLIGKRRRKLCV